MQESTRTYGKYVVAGAIGIGVGVAGYAAYDTPAEQTDVYQNLQDQLETSQANADDFEAQVADLQTTVTDKEERVSNLEAQVEQFNKTVEELRSENADLEDAVATAQERVGLVDYLPVFSDSDVEFETDGLSVEVEADADAEEGEYDRISANYTSDDGDYDVEITEYEESEDADDAVEDFRDTQAPVEFSSDGDEHTVTVNGYSGKLNKMYVVYDDFDAIEDVDNEDDIESVVVDGEDITDKVNEVNPNSGNDEFEIVFDEDYYVNDGESITVTYSDASDEGEPKTIKVDGNGWNTFDYDKDDYDQREDIYRDGNTVVEVTGNADGDEFEAQYEDLASQYE